MRGAMGRHAVAVVLFVLSACGGGGGGSGGPDTDVGPPPAGSDYFPLGAGDRWLYQVDDNGTPAVYESEVGSTSSVGGRARTEVVTTTMGGVPVDVSSYSSTAAGVTAFAAPGDAFSGAVGPYLLLRLPATPGDSFVQVDTNVDSGVDVDGDGVRERLQILSNVRVVEQAALATAAGDFPQALHLRTTIDETLVASRSGARVTARAVSDDWFAAGVGRLQSDMTITVNGQQVSRTSSTLLAYRAGGRHGGASPVVATAAPDGRQVHDGGTAVAASFGVPMDVDSLNAGGFTVTDAAGRSVPGQVALGQDRLSATFVPDAGWYSGNFTARITASATDRYGNAATPHTWTFTLDAVVPTIAVATPADGATGVATDARLTYVFSEALDAATVAPGGLPAFTITDDATGASAPAILSFDGVATFDIAPRTYWPHDRSYTITFPAGMADLPGNPLGAARQVRFSTATSLFAPPIPVAASMGRGAFATVGDVDGDGRADLVWTAWDDTVFPPQVRLFLRRGLADGSFGPAVEPIAAPAYLCGVFAIAVGDSNGDGRSDLVVGGSCGIRVLLQGADGLFTQGPHYTLPEFDFASSLKLVDLDRDGRLDMLSAGNGSFFRVWLQSPAGMFSQVGTVETGLGSLTNLEVADLDGDGLSDVVASSIGMQTDRLAVLHGLPGGGFGAPMPLVTGDGWPYGLAVGDSDGDSTPDIVVSIGGTDSPRVLIFHQRVDHSFASPVTIPLTREPLGVYLMNIGGGGESLVVRHSDAFAVLPVPGDGMFGPADYYEVRRLPGDDGFMAVGPRDARGQAVLAFNGQVFMPLGAQAMAPMATTRRLVQLQREQAAALAPLQGAYRGTTLRRVFAPPRGFSARPAATPR